MDAGAARVAQLKDPRKVRILLGSRLIWSEIWDLNPRLAGPKDDGDFNVVYGRDPVTDMRAYHTRKSQERWQYNLDFRPHPGEIYFSTIEKNFSNLFSPHIIVEPNLKRKASPNKDWGWDRWQEFAYLAAAVGISLQQLGPVGTKTLNGVRLLVTPSFRQACAVLARAKAYVGHEGGMHHAAAALGIPGIVIFGGYIAVETTGYPIHRNLGVHVGDACGMRVPCEHCAAEMQKITPAHLLSELRGLL